MLTFDSFQPLSISFWDSTFCLPLLYLCQYLRQLLGGAHQQGAHEPRGVEHARQLVDLALQLRILLLTYGQGL